MVRLTGITKTFNGLSVLKDLDFSAPAGTTTAIIGPSGTGKSTLLRCINLLEIPDAGELRIAADALTFGGGKQEHRLKQKDILTLRRHTGMVFQGFHLFPHKTVLENIIEGPVQVLKQKREEAVDFAESLLKKVELLDKKDAYPSTLSGGQQQRAAIARALGMRPDVLLFDEPTSALDPELEREVLKVIHALADERKTMLIVTHNLLFAKNAADFIARMDGGRIAAYGTPQEMLGATELRPPQPRLWFQSPPHSPNLAQQLL